MMTTDKIRGDKEVGADMTADTSEELWRIDRLDAALFRDPIEFFYADHHRQRQAALILSAIASGEYDTDGIARLIEFLEHDFALHIGDEELCFFPILKECSLPEDNIDDLIARLEEEHKSDQDIGEEAIALLRKRKDGTRLTPQECGRIAQFAEHILQHLALENAVLIPIARVRLNDASVKLLSQMLKERRAQFRG